MNSTRYLRNRVVIVYFKTKFYMFLLRYCFHHLILCIFIVYSHSSNTKGADSLVVASAYYKTLEYLLPDNDR